MFARTAFMLEGGLLALGIVFCCVLPWVKSLVIQTTVKQMFVSRADTPVIVDPVPGRPGHYTDENGQLCCHSKFIRKSTDAYPQKGSFP